MSAISHNFRKSFDSPTKWCPASQFEIFTFSCGNEVFELLNLLQFATEQTNLRSVARFSRLSIFLTKKWFTVKISFSSSFEFSKTKTRCGSGSVPLEPFHMEALFKVNEKKKYCKLIILKYSQYNITLYIIIYNNIN